MSKNIIKWAALGVTTLFAFYLVIALYAQNQYAFAALFLVVLGSAVYIFGSRRAYAHRYIFPAIGGMVIFVIFPLIYTIGIGFTNYSASNLLSFERVTNQLLSREYLTGPELIDFKIYHQNPEYIIQLELPNGELLETPPFEFEIQGKEPLQVLPAKSIPISEPLKIRDIVRLKDKLRGVILTTGDTNLSLAGLRQFGAMSPLYTQQEDGSIYNNQEGKLYTPNHDTGFYEDESGKELSPGWTVNIGWDNYLKVVTDPSIREPFIQIFIWTVSFAGLTVLFTLALGLLLANLLQWELIKGKGFYRMMLILPYAVPAFISILVFKGLFNQNFGEINLVLEGLFGIRPDWFSDAGLARTMLLIVNTWLGYPYMMLLCMGMLQAIPRDLYEASAMDGATPIDNLFQITLPQLIRPLLPLLIASFAFNFNNFVLIALLTGGAPDIIGATTPAGTTDLLVSYTYRIAFQDSGQNFGLAAAIATAIFILVGSLSLLNLKLSKVQV